MIFNPFSQLHYTLQSKERITSIDFWRGLAILAVIFFHFDKYLPFGELGVDLFFVISGLLVGGLLTKPYLNKDPINYSRFFLRRGFKIWPSYYVFLILGTLLAMATYNQAFANQIIHWYDAKRYLLFYQNYTGLPTHWSFDHIWSLCVEEHFYILLPLLFIFLSIIKGNWKYLAISLILLIILGFVFKILVLDFTNSKDTYSATHNRIDALAWGVLLNLIIIKYKDSLKKFNYSYLLTIIGIIGFSISVYYKFHTTSIFFDKVVFHSITPIFFFLMLLGTYYSDFSKLKIIRVFGYYSYNWYLWHPPIAIIIIQWMGTGIAAFITYFIVSFFIGMFFTIVVEEPILAMRKRLKRVR